MVAFSSFVMRKDPIRIACVGEAMIELSFPPGAPGGPEVGYAGDTLNTAIYLKRAIQHFGEVTFLTVLGTDRFSDQMVDFISREGVKTDAIKRDPDRLPGLYAITTDPDGERSFHYWRDNSAARQLFQTPDGLDFTSLAGFDVIYFSAITLAILPVNVRQALLDWIAQARTNGDCLFAFDSNYRPSLWTKPGEARNWVEKAWRITDIALPSMDDERAVFNDASTKEILARFSGYGPKTGALKNGADGPLPLSAVAGLPEFSPAPKVVDTTAAGDSFNGAFLGATLTGQNLPTALAKGHQCASKVVGFAGAFAKNRV